MNDCAVVSMTVVSAQATKLQGCPVSHRKRDVAVGRRMQRMEQCRRERRLRSGVSRDVPISSAVGSAEAEFVIPEAPPEAAPIRETEVIVIGGGIGGLSCAAILAHYGVKVNQISCSLADPLAASTLASSNPRRSVSR